MAAALLMSSIGVAGASAADAIGLEDPTSQTVVVNGQEYGPEDGVEVVTESFAVTPGGGPVGSFYGGSPGGISTFDVWGSSYATSAEIAYLYYQGKAKAGGNVFNGQRIIDVCIWYTRVGVNPSATVCSSASYNGYSWVAGSEKTVGFWDNLSVNWPSSVFNIRTTRINPQIN